MRLKIRLIWRKIVVSRVETLYFYAKMGSFSWNHRHTVVWKNYCDLVSTTLWKSQKFTPTEKIFRQNTYLVISLVKLSYYFHEIFAKIAREWIPVISTVCTVLEITEIYSHAFLAKIS